MDTAQLSNPVATAPITIINPFFVGVKLFAVISVAVVFASMYNSVKDAYNRTRNSRDQDHSGRV